MSEDASPPAQDLDALVLSVDPDRWLASRLIAEPEARADVVALYAFDHELARAPKGGDRRSRIVIIGRDIAEGVLEESLAFLNSPAETLRVIRELFADAPGIPAAPAEAAA